MRGDSKLTQMALLVSLKKTVPHNTATTYSNNIIVIDGQVLQISRQLTVKHPIYRQNKPGCATDAWKMRDVT